MRLTNGQAKVLRSLLEKGRLHKRVQGRTLLFVRRAGLVTFGSAMNPYVLTEAGRAEAERRARRA